MNKVVAVLGASDPEMNIIKKTLESCGIKSIQARSNGRPVHPGNAYKADPVQIENGQTLLRVECEPQSISPGNIDVVVIDHHRPGDPGFGQGPEHYWEASSVGQTFKWLADNELLTDQARELLPEAKLAAAADHCLGAAYKGQCPGIDVKKLMDWRIETKAAFQKVTKEVIRDRVNSAFNMLNLLPPIKIFNTVPVVNAINTDIPELPEALAIAGKAAVYSMNMPNGKIKVGVLNGVPEEISAFMDAVKTSSIFNGIYGDPQRGFAGAYVSDTIHPDTIGFALREPKAMKEIVDFNMSVNEMPKCLENMEKSVSKSPEARAGHDGPGTNGQDLSPGA